MLIQFHDATVQSVIDYSAAVWGTKSISSISAVQNCACRFFLGLGRTGMHLTLRLMVTWVGLHQNTGNGCASLENDAGW